MYVERERTDSEWIEAACVSLEWEQADALHRIFDRLVAAESEARRRVFTVVEDAIVAAGPCLINADDLLNDINKRLSVQ